LPEKSQTGLLILSRFRNTECPPEGGFGMGASKPVEPVVRALKLLEVLNRKSASSLGDLRAATGLPKPTLIRLLDTLIAAGYGARISSEAGYRITENVLALSIGLRFIDRIVDAAVPAMSQFTREHDWPIGLAKVRDGVVALLHSTAPQSPLSFERAGYNRTYPLIPSALGQAYLAFCSADERRRLIRELLPDNELVVLGMRDTQTLEAHLALVRRRGYAVTLSPRPYRVLGLAVPVRQGRQVLACLVMRFPRSVMTHEQAADRYLGSLNATARTIVTALAAQDRAN
jgi:IclR family transcriptional regulator, mhp operon transcriptional activator